MMTRALPLIGAALFAGVGFGWRSWYQYRHFGNSGWRLFRSGHWAQHLRDSGLVVLSGLIGAQAAAYAFDAAWLNKLALAPPPDGVGMALGAVLFFSGLILLVKAQLDLGASWRIGIDERERPGLVTRGIYGFSRNPIYMALFVMLTGFLVLVPTWLSLGVLLGTIAAVRNQVRQEEQYLRGMYGTDFITYARRVGRFLPGLGTLAG